MRAEVETNSQDETEKFGQVLGGQLRGGELIELIGDVGAGKTTFVRGLARGLESDDHVSSPTFTVCNTYKGRKTLHHCDFYRLQDDALIEKEVKELAQDDSVLVLEWAEEVTGALPKELIKIEITTNGENSRKFDITYALKYEYIKL
jgi:tRNA threonylcarbamoyladenosine biosynthesis protein TsaE